MNHDIVRKEFEEKYSEKSSMKDLRSFVRTHSLPIRDRSKMGLFQKIKVYLKEVSKQTTLVQFFKKGKEKKKKILTSESVKSEIVYVKEEYVPFLKYEMTFDEEKWNAIKKFIIVNL